LLSDRTDFLQLGSSNNRYFYSGFNDLNPQPSSWNAFPTEEDPFAQYKFCSVSFELDKNLRQINRQTYSFLDWLGDCGGLLDALYIIAEMLVGPVSAFALRSKLVSTLVKFQKSSPAPRDGPS